MSSNRTRRIITRTLFVLILSIGIFVFIFKQRISDVYDNTIQPTSFQDVIFEKDTSINSTLPEKNLPIDSSAQDQGSLKNSSSASKKSSASNNSSSDEKTGTGQENTTKESFDAILPVRKGKEIKADQIPLMHMYNSRIRLSKYLTIFKQGDYISGMEFSNLYKRDPTIGKLAKNTICGFIEKNISQLTRSGNSFIVQTIDPKGIHTRLKIPFVEDLQINIDNGAQLVIGDSFTSTAPAFNKSILLPIQLKLINILHNGEQFPTSGYVSGDFYFIDYSKTKMAYKLR